MKFLTFSKMPLNRCTVERKDQAWVQSQFKERQAVIIPHWRGRYIYCEQKLLTLDYRDVENICDRVEQEVIFLGLHDEKPWFVYDISSIEEEVVLEKLRGQVELVDFRASLPWLENYQVPILGYGNALCHWHRQSKFCGKCGAKNKPHEGGHMLKCISDKCANQTFPRTDPVVIMLVVHKDLQGVERCLLATHHRINANVYSTLAGFIDPGETIEEAVAREVKEEAGVSVSNVKYFASQPWPFPSSLMIGCKAVATDPTLNIDYDEISGAEWFTAEQVSSFDNWGDPGDNKQLPRHESIARALIDSWLDEAVN